MSKDTRADYQWRRNFAFVKPCCVHAWQLWQPESDHFVLINDGGGWSQITAFK